MRGDELEVAAVGVGLERHPGDVDVLEEAREGHCVRERGVLED